MKLLMLPALLMALPAFAQLPEADFPDFTHTDIEGNVHNLYSYLDDGKTVIIDIFATWCPNCIASIPGVEEIWETHGPDGDNTMMVLAFERDPETTNEAVFASNYNIGPPIIAEAAATVLSWGITYQPNYFVICPDRTYDIKPGAIGSNPDPVLNLAVQCGIVSPVEETTVPIEWSLARGVLSVTGASFSGQPLQIFDAAGREMQVALPEKGAYAADLSGLNPGLYTARIGTSVFRFVLKA